MARVLCTGVNPVLMKTRQLILESAGHTVVPASDEREIRPFVVNRNSTWLLSDKASRERSKFACWILYGSIVPRPGFSSLPYPTGARLWRMRTLGLKCHLTLKNWRRL
jgi:hypothetical protein